MNEIEELLRQIEELRRTLHKLATEKKLTDQEVLIASQMLDALLNEYEKLIKRKKSPSI